MGTYPFNSSMVQNWILMVGKYSALPESYFIPKLDDATIAMITFTNS